MVIEINKEDKKYYQCEKCGFYYETKELAEECENYCKENKSCNVEITKKAVGREEIKTSKNLNLSSLILGLILGSLLIFAFSKLPIQTKINQNKINQQNSQLQNLILEVQNQVFPPKGFQTRLAFGDAFKKMIDCGVVDLEKMKKLYNGKIPDYIQKLINGSNEPIVINFDTANYLLNIFWPLGLSNKTEFNKNIPFSKDQLPYLASTGGWWLGKEDNGAVYFNKCEIIKLSKEQEDLVYEVAQNTFRPCCNNSTFAQDCNHGSALLGALELAASQGYTKDELYKLAVQLNSYWFPQEYLKIATYFKLIEGKDWNQVDPKLIMSANYSSISGYMENVEKKLANLNIQGFQIGGSGCGL
ncbi:MAG: hypothetical protein C4348_00700 [Patescibacteria group bacterium]